VLREPIEVLDGKVVPDIELIPPVHQRVYKMGLEHLGVVVGDTFDAFVGAHKPVLTGQQFQGPNSTPDPVYILMEDFTHVKFYRLSLRASIELFDGPFEDGFQHVDDWVPQRLVAATGPNPCPGECLPSSARSWTSEVLDQASHAEPEPDGDEEHDRENAIPGEIVDQLSGAEGGPRCSGDHRRNHPEDHERDQDGAPCEPRVAAGKTDNEAHDEHIRSRDQ
jgi:hypothetical protein